MSHPTRVIAALATQLGDGDWDEISSRTIVLDHSKRHTLNPICPSELLQKHHENLLQWMALAGVAMVSNFHTQESVLSFLSCFWNVFRHLWQRKYAYKRLQVYNSKYVAASCCIVQTATRKSYSILAQRTRQQQLTMARANLHSHASKCQPRSQQQSQAKNFYKPASTNPLARPGGEK